MEIQGFTSFNSSVSSLSSANSRPQVQPQSEQVETAPTPEAVADQVSIAGEGDKKDGTVSLRILHINDVHGAALEEGGRGGMAKAATVFGQEKASAPGEVLTVNTGDLAEGSMVSYLTKGGVISESMAQIGFDVVEPGNHDFVWGQEALHNMLEGTNATILNASIVNDGDGSTFGEPFLIRDVGGVKVGMIGLDVENMARYISEEKLEGLEFRSSADTLREYIPKAKEAGADVIMVLSHIGFDEDKKIAQQFPEIDLIVGGHSHTELQEGYYEGNTLIVQSGTKGQFVGEVDLELDLATKKIAGATARLIPVDESVEPDPQVAAIIQKSIDSVAEIGSRVMGVAEEDLSFSYFEQGKINQIHADSVMEATGADLVIVSSRNPRGGVPKGEVTYEKLFNAFPHTEEDVVTMRCTGEMLLKEMEKRVSDDGRGAVTPAGFTYKYDKSRPNGERIYDIKMNDGSDFDPKKEYFVGTTISMARKFPQATDKKTIGSGQETFMEFFQKGGTWRDDPDARVIEAKH